jgi:uncharacterized RDD family membrane protein YckC
MAMAGSVAVSMGAKAGFWIRTVAYIIDAIILGIVTGVITAVLRLDQATSGNGLGLLINIVYFVVLWSSTGGGQTLGMRILNLKVIRTDGSELSIVQALIRWVGLFVSFIVIFIGVIWVAFDSEKQGWHDKIAGTYVVKTK